MHQITKARKGNEKEIALLNKQFNLDIPSFYWNSEEWISSEIEKGNYYVLMENTQILGAMNLEKYKKEYVVSTIAIKEDMHGKNLGEKTNRIC